MTKLAFVGVVAIKVLLVASFSVPKSAEAGLLSAVAGFFGSQTAASEVSNSSSNSQKMPLLEAPINPDASAGSFSAAAPVSNSVLAAASPSVAPEPAAPAKKSEPASKKITTYTVKSGDTITGIADDFDISVNTILWANNLKWTSKLSIGQKLIILPMTGVQHKVVSGDTLQGIAAKHKADVEDVMAFNNISKTDVLKIGDIVLIPDGEMVTAPEAPAKPKLASVKNVASAALGVGIVKADSAAVAASGYYMRPISGGTKTQGLHGSNGVDLADSCGTPIYASAGGAVEVAETGGYNGGYGKYVVLNHSNGSQTLYSHMNTVSVQVGDQVAKGDVIGTIGATGKVTGATGCHVHFEIRGSGYANPF